MYSLKIVDQLEYTHEGFVGDSLRLMGLTNVLFVCECVCKGVWRVSCNSNTNFGCMKLFFCFFVVRNSLMGIRCFHDVNTNYCVQFSCKHLVVARGLTCINLYKYVSLYKYKKTHEIYLINLEYEFGV